MSGQPYWESAVEKQIREAQERGEFDNLPGAGKPLAQRENLDLGGALPGALALRKEAATYPQALADVRTEAQVREIVEDYNKRVLADRLRPAVGNLPPLLAKTLDVDEMVAAWRGLRDEREAQLRAAREEREAAAAAARQPAPSWWSRLL